VRTQIGVQTLYKLSSNLISSYGFTHLRSPRSYLSCYHFYAKEYREYRALGRSIRSPILSRNPFCSRAASMSKNAQKGAKTRKTFRSRHFAILLPRDAFAKRVWLLLLEFRFSMHTHTYIYIYICIKHNENRIGISGRRFSTIGRDATT